MPRFPRNYLQTTYFHIITQGINKSYIFKNDIDKKYYIKTMYELKKEYNIKIIAYCIMDNHMHMLLEVSQIQDLSRYMHKLNTKYGKYYNREYKRVGYVFRDRYKSEGIYSEEQLYNCINYIYNNPVKAKICNSPDKYKYSNYTKVNSINKKGEYKFIDYNDISEEEKIERYLLQNKIDIKNIIKDKTELKKTIIELKINHSVSLRKIAEKFKINRETVRKLYKNYVK